LGYVVVGDRRFLVSHLLLPVALLALCTLLFEGFHWDFWLADQLYQWEGGQWSLKDNPWLANVLHTGARNLLSLMALIVVAAWCLSFVLPSLSRFNNGLGYLSISSLASVFCISLLKHVTGVPCPWEMSPFGGSVDYHSIGQYLFQYRQASECFPAGHASAGFAWFGLYFIARQKRLQHPWIVLITIILMGASLGFVQQLRGAHLISHDLWTAVLCWLIAVLCSPILKPKPSTQDIVHARTAH
jgi:membrane-associated PAP2 superfamily phosphatase